VALAKAMSGMKGQVPPAAFQHAAQTLLAYVRNLVAHPDDPRFRRIKVELARVDPSYQLDDCGLQPGRRPSQAWSPATIFVVSDHLHHMLIRNMFRRNPTPGIQEVQGMRGASASSCALCSCPTFMVVVQTTNTRYKAAVGSQPHGAECMAALGFQPIMEASEEVKPCCCVACLPFTASSSVARYMR
jgi:PUB domain